MAANNSSSQQLHHCLLQLAASSSDVAATTAALNALTQVPWFAEAVTAAVGQLQITADGQLAIEQQQNVVNNSSTQACLSHLLATLVATQLHKPNSSAVAEHLVTQLLPQLLSSPQPAVDESNSSSWVGILCEAAAELYVCQHAGAVQLAAACVRQLEELTAAAAGAVSLTQGTQACLQLLAAVLDVTQPCRGAASTLSTPTTSSASPVDPNLLHSLLECVVNPQAAGHAVSKVLQHKLVPAVMAAAAAAASADTAGGVSAAAYNKACQQLLLAVCSSSGVSTVNDVEQRDSSKVSEALALACRLQPHILHACASTGGDECQPAMLHGLLLQGLLHGDLHCRQRAVHLLEACVGAGCAPQVLSADQWTAYVMLYQVEEEHMLHLIQPLWQQYFAPLWQQGQQQEGDAGACRPAHESGLSLVSWCSVLVLRAAFHSNAGVQRMGLAGFLQLDTELLRQLMQQQGAWPEIQQLLLQLLPAFADRKLVSQSAAGSASNRQAEAVAVLQHNLGSFLGRCMQLLQEQQQQQRENQEAEGQKGSLPTCAAVQQLLHAYLDQIVATGDRVATLLLLINALAEGLGAAFPNPACGSSSSVRTGPQGSSSTGSPEGLLPVILRVLGAAAFAQPAYQRPALCRAVQQLVPHCLQPCSAGPAGALSLLAACSPLVGAAQPSSGCSAGDAQQQQQETAQRVEQYRTVFGCSGFLQWLQAALESPECNSSTSAGAGAAAAAAGSKHSVSGGVLGALLLDVGRASSTLAQQQYAALHCLGMLASDLGQQLMQALVQALQQTTAAAVQCAGDAHAVRSQQQLTACAALLAGSIAGSSSAKQHQPPQQQQQQPVVSCVAAVLPALLQHHLTLCASGSAAFDADWCETLVAVVAAAAANTQLHHVMLPQLSGWLQQLPDWLATAASRQPAVSLQEQVLLLTSARTACCALTAAAAVQGSASEHAGSHQQQLLQDSQLVACLRLLCQLTPSQVISTSGTTNSSSSLSKMELTDLLLQLHAAVLHQLVAAAAHNMSPETRQLVMSRCMEDLDWSSQHTLQQLLHVLLLTAPFPSMQQQQQESPQQQPSNSVGGAAADEQVAQLQAMLQLLRPLVRTSTSISKRFSAAEVSLIVNVFFHPGLFSCRELLPLLTDHLIPFALVQGGSRLSTAVMSHLCYNVLASNPPLLDHLLPQIAHMAAFSLFSESVSQAAALQQQKCDMTVLLPSRVVLCAFLVQVARSGRHTPFMSRLVGRLMSIAQAAPQHSSSGSGSCYAWLAAREASQSSGANAIRMAVWQALCLLAAYIPEAQLQQVLEQGWSCLLCSHQHANIRPHVQLFLLVLFSRLPSAVPALLLPALCSFSTSSYQVAVSVIILGMFVLLQLGPTSPQFMPLLRALLPWALHHRHAVRVPVQVMLHVTFHRHMAAIEGSLGQEATQLLQEVRRFLLENEEVAKLRERQGLVDLEGFDLRHETSVQGVFGISHEQLEQLCDGESDSTGLQWPLFVRDRLPLDLLSCIPGAVKAVGDRRGAASTTAAAAAVQDVGAAAAVGVDDDGSSGGGGGGLLAGAAVTEDAPGSVALHQFRPQIQASLFDEAAADRVDALVQARASRPGLILCASLLENLPNLAGMCRTCESLSAEALVVASKAVVQTDAFKKQSRTSERHLRILEVGLTDVATFLQEQKAAGYTIIGVEQATNSVALQNYSFPLRCVVLLGNEQSGMPAPLLPLLDACLEIPMLGVTRSLNAHVSGAMVMWQYTQQQLSKTGGEAAGGT